MLQQTTDELVKINHSNGSRYQIPRRGEETFLEDVLGKEEEFRKSFLSQQDDKEGEGSPVRGKEVVILASANRSILWLVESEQIPEPSCCFAVVDSEKEEVLSISAGFSPGDWVGIDHIKPQVDKYFGEDKIKEVRVRKRKQVVQLYRPIN